MNEGLKLVIYISDPDTFDADLSNHLKENHHVIRGYLIKDREIYETYDNYFGQGRPLFRPENPYWGSFNALLEKLIPVMHERLIRGFHYSRMTDTEVEVMLAEGIRLSTLAFLEARLNSLVSAGILADHEIRKIIAESPFNTQLEHRQNMFWMVSARLPMDDCGVEPLLSTWGGEVASMHLTDPDLLGKLQTIGRPRMIEVAVPMSATNKAYSAVRAVVAAYALQHGWPSERDVFDFYVMRDLPCKAILQVYTHG